VTAPAAIIYDPEVPAPPDELYATYRVLRDDFPVYEDPDGRFVALTRYTDVYDAASDAASFSSEMSNSRLVHPILAQIDPPRHAAMRKVILRAFTPTRVAALEPEVRAIASKLLDALPRDEPFDFMESFAALLPSAVIGRLVGIPDELLPHCREISDLHMRRITQRDALVPMRMSDEVFGELLEARRRRPEDDLLTALLAAEVDGRRLSQDELLGFGYLLLIGGNDTTTNWIGNGAALLAHHPDVRARISADPAFSSLPNALEEVLRMESPTQLLPRRAATDVARHDTMIAAGMRVLLVWGAANRDERAFAAPDEFDAVRAGTRHLAFGQGIHFCLGAALARLEARVAFEELLTRFPAYELAGCGERVRSSWALGYAHLPVVGGRLSGA
jgi:cytochrome P450